MVNNYLKRFAAWATGWWERFANKLLKGIFAREILQSQKRFISDVAHELRTPLSVIKTSAEVALIDPALPRDAQETFREILAELERVSQIINNLLSLNSLARPEQILFKSLDIGAVAEVVVARHRPLARERGLRVRLRTKVGSIAWANASAVEQIIANLLKNALMYTPQNGGPVVINIGPVAPQSAAEEARIRLVVEDSGVGIAPKDLAHIFEPFYRADLSRTRLQTKTGSGLGLTIVNELVRAQHGTIDIQSRRGKGTSVTVLLPAGGSLRGDISNASHSPIVQDSSGTVLHRQEETAIWSPIRAAVTFLRGW